MLSMRFPSGSLELWPVLSRGCLCDQPLGMVLGWSFVLFFLFADMISYCIQCPPEKEKTDRQTDT